MALRGCLAFFPCRRIGVQSHGTELSSAGAWVSIAWDGTNFCVVGGGPSGTPSADVMTSPTGTTWTTRTGALPQQLGIESLWCAVNSNGSGLFVALSHAGYVLGSQFSNSIVATSATDGVT